MTSLASPPSAPSTENRPSPILAARFPRLARLPRVPLVNAPTPVHRADRISGFTGHEVWVKRDDLANEVYGGNKVRKLEYLLGDARAKGADTILTTGALGSHHALATAIHGRANGFDVHAFLSPQPWTQHVDENLRCHLAVGTELHPIRSMLLSSAAMQMSALKLRSQGKKPYVIPHGGSNAIGALGYVEAGLELAAQLDAKAMPEPDVVYTSLGSGATAVGLALGLAAGGVPIPVRAVLVTTRLVGNKQFLRHLMRATLAELRAIEPRFPSVYEIASELLAVDDAWLAVGYGVVNDEVERVTELAAADDVILDPTYTAPAVATLMEDAEANRVKRALFLHTLSSADLGPLLRKAPIGPRWAPSFAGKAR